MLLKRKRELLSDETYLQHVILIMEKEDKDNLRKTKCKRNMHPKAREKIISELST